MATLIKSPLPKNWKTGKVTLSHEEVLQVQSGYFDRLVIMKYRAKPAMALLNKPITQAMVNSISNKGEYYLMTYRF